MIKNRILYKYFTDDELLRISNEIRDVEKRTSGEVAVSIKEKRRFLSRGKAIEELAQNEFIRLGVGRTKDATGILFFLLLSERKFTILADKGINEAVKKETWEEIKKEMESYFSRGEFSTGIITGIKRGGEVLASYFPIKQGDINELSNRVIIR